MNVALKIKQLWRYLKIQDDEILIVQSYNHASGTDEFFVTEKVGMELKTNVVSNIQLLHLNKPFRLIQQLDSSGKHTIPLVEQLKRDEIADY